MQEHLVDHFGAFQIKCIYERDIANGVAVCFQSAGDKQGGFERFDEEKAGEFWEVNRTSKSKGKKDRRWV